MGMCKGCGEIFNTNDMLDGYCKECSVNPKVDTSKPINNVKESKFTIERNQILSLTLSTVIAYIISVVSYVIVEFYDFLDGDGIYGITVPIFILFNLFVYYILRYKKTFQEALEDTRIFLEKWKMILILIVAGIIIGQLSSITNSLQSISEYGAMAEYQRDIINEISSLKYR